ncbi:hypothetical protein P0D88_41495 [Paraburkholderia sp. RL18-103-BIB-C]|uniref:hypothetical protein n=1 Tax=unclassified Paraburkholderia TaxID=2615204 RepID=UPI0038BA6BDB
MKTFKVVSFTLLAFAAGGWFLGMHWMFDGACRDITWCAGWIEDVQGRRMVAGYAALPLIGLAVLLALAGIYGRTRRGNAFNTGQKISSYYEGSKKTFFGALGLFYFFELVVWASRTATDVLYLALAFGGLVALLSLLAFVSGLSNLLRWLLLEAKGMEWAGAETGGNQAFRSAYRRGDGSGLVNLATREQRGVEELDYGRKQRVPMFICWILLAGAVFARSAVYGYSEYLGAALTYVVLPALVAKAATDLIYLFAYQDGAQFIPGAKVMDGPVKRISPELLKDEMPHGDARFEETDDVVWQMGGGKNGR